MDEKILWLHPKATKEEKDLALEAVEESFPDTEFIIEVPTLEEATMLRQIFAPDSTDEEFWDVDTAILFEEGPPMEIAWSRERDRQDPAFMLFPKSHIAMMDEN